MGTPDTTTQVFEELKLEGILGNMQGTEDGSDSTSETSGETAKSKDESLSQ